MKRKHWEPGGGNKELRGRDEWVRISWDEALDYIADGLKDAKENYGNNSILAPTFFAAASNFFHNLLSAYGGYTFLEDTGSFGSFWFAHLYGLPPKGYEGANDRMDLRKAETVVLYGGNPAWASTGNRTYNMMQVKKAGANFIYVGPEYNVSANLFDAKWIRVRPGTDTAFLLAVVYTMLKEDDPVSNPIIDWDFLNSYTVGFDAEHMPADAKLDENFKDYILGKYDGQPKTPEWASEICGTPVEDIVWYAREMRKDKKVSILHSYAPSRCNNAESFPQLLMAIAAMGGHFGKPGHSCGGMHDQQAGNCGPPLVYAGTNYDMPELPNPVDDIIYAPEVWDAILEGKYNRTATLTRDLNNEGMRDIDIRVIYHVCRDALAAVVGTNKGIEAHRKVDLVVAHTLSLNSVAQYADIVLPIATQWEIQYDQGYLRQTSREFQMFPSQITEPLYEVQTDQWIGEELAKRLGMDPKIPFPVSLEQRYYDFFAGAQVINEAGTDYENLVTVTEDDIVWWNQNVGKAEGKPQQGRIGLKQLKEVGFYQVPRSEDDNYGHISYEEFVKDPGGNPLSSKSGKFEIYCQSYADVINGMGRSKIKPYPAYARVLNGYEESFSDFDKRIKGDYPYQIFNVHYLRRADTAYDNIPWLKEAWTSPVFINTQDAIEKGVKDGDTVLVWNQYGKILRRASLTNRLMPGCINLPNGAWPEIEEDTGIDKAGGANTLCAPVATGIGVSGYNTNLVDFEKYKGDPLTPDHLWPLRVINYL